MLIGVLAALCLTHAGTPAQAWEAAMDGRICTLTHDEPDASIRLTHDPAIPEYTLTITRRDMAWTSAAVFGIRFDGPRPIYITTDRHVLGPANATLSVADRGFGNVLDGLQFNRVAIAMTGDQAVTLPLDGAAPEVATFRNCTVAPSV